MSPIDQTAELPMDMLAPQPAQPRTSARGSGEERDPDRPPTSTRDQLASDTTACLGGVAEASA